MRARRVLTHMLLPWVNSLLILNRRFDLFDLSPWYYPQIKIYMVNHYEYGVSRVSIAYPPGQVCITSQLWTRNRYFQHKFILSLNTLIRGSFRVLEQGRGSTSLKHFQVLLRVLNHSRHKSNGGWRGREGFHLYSMTTYKIRFSAPLPPPRTRNCLWSCWLECIDPITMVQ